MRFEAIWKFAAAGMMAMVMMAPGQMKAQSSGTVLKPADMEKLLPASVFYRGQTANIQLRNSGGVKFADGHYVLAALVDTSGYSTDISTKYQAYFVTEVPIVINGSDLKAGVYGVGFMKDDMLIVTDVGGNDVLMVNAGVDKEMKHPMPLQVATDPAGGFRLYAGRRFVNFTR
jgi:hypothetical protein